MAIYLNNNFLSDSILKYKLSNSFRKNTSNEYTASVNNERVTEFLERITEEEINEISNKEAIDSFFENFPLDENETCTSILNFDKLHIETIIYLNATKRLNKETLDRILNSETYENRTELLISLLNQDNEINPFNPLYKAADKKIEKIDVKIGKKSNKYLNENIFYSNFKKDTFLSLNYGNFLTAKVGNKNTIPVKYLNNLDIYDFDIFAHITDAISKIDKRKIYYMALKLFYNNLYIKPLNKLDFFTKLSVIQKKDIIIDKLLSRVIHDENIEYYLTLDTVLDKLAETFDSEITNEFYEDIQADYNESFSYILGKKENIKKLLLSKFPNYFFKNSDGEEVFIRKNSKELLEFIFYVYFIVWFIKNNIALLWNLDKNYIIKITNSAKNIFINSNPIFQNFAEDIENEFNFLIDNIPDEFTRKEILLRPIIETALYNALNDVFDNNMSDDTKIKKLIVDKLKEELNRISDKKENTVDIQSDIVPTETELNILYAELFKDFISNDMDIKISNIITLQNKEKIGSKISTILDNLAIEHNNNKIIKIHNSALSETIKNITSKINADIMNKLKISKFEVLYFEDDNNINSFLNELNSIINDNDFNNKYLSFLEGSYLYLGYLAKYIIKSYCNNFLLSYNPENKIDFSQQNREISLENSFKLDEDISSLESILKYRFIYSNFYEMFSKMESTTFYKNLLHDAAGDAFFLDTLIDVAESSKEFISNLEKEGDDDILLNKFVTPQLNNILTALCALKPNYFERRGV